MVRGDFGFFGRTWESAPDRLAGWRIRRRWAGFGDSEIRIEPVGAPCSQSIFSAIESGLARLLTRLGLASLRLTIDPIWLELPLRAGLAPILQAFLSRHGAELAEEWTAFRSSRPAVPEDRSEELFEPSGHPDPTSEPPEGSPATAGFVPIPLSPAPLQVEVHGATAISIQPSSSAVSIPSLFDLLTDLDEGAPATAGFVPIPLSPASLQVEVHGADPIPIEPPLTAISIAPLDNLLTD
jgi:hypothetical protein